MLPAIFFILALLCVVGMPFCGLSKRYGDIAIMVMFFTCVVCAGIGAICTICVMIGKN